MTDPYGLQRALDDFTVPISVSELPYRRKATTTDKACVSSPSSALSYNQVGAAVRTRQRALQPRPR